MGRCGSASQGSAARLVGVGASQDPEDAHSQLRPTHHDDRNDERPVGVADQYAAPSCALAFLCSAVGFQVSSVRTHRDERIWAQAREPIGEARWCVPLAWVA